MTASTVLDVGVACRPAAGETESGDRHVVVPTKSGALVAVVDGLGHGEAAAVAARVAIDTVVTHAAESPARLLERCHLALRRTRGAVASLVSVDGRAGMLTWLGVGNVEGVLWRHADQAVRRERLVLQAGTLGVRLPGLRAAHTAVHEGDLLVLATDGLRSHFAHTQPGAGTPQAIAERLLELHGGTRDDALVLVACVRGGEECP